MRPVDWRTQSDGCFTRDLRPIATGDVGKDEEGFPNLGGTIGEFGWDDRFCLFDLRAMFGDEPGAGFADGGCFGFESFQSFAALVSGLFGHLDENAAIGERFGEAADLGNGFGTPGGKVAKAAFRLKVER